MNSRVHREAIGLLLLSVVMATALSANDSETFPPGEITVEGGESIQGNGCKYEWESWQRGGSRG